MRVSNLSRPIRMGSLVLNKKSNYFGVLIKKSIFEDYYYVFSKGCLREWHISNIDTK
jgi:hypothetical protein